MSNQNQLGQLGYGQTMDTGDEGEAHADLKARNGVNPELVQIDTVTIGGTASDGAYTLSITDLQSGQVYSTSFTRGSGESNAQIAAALAAQAEAEDDPSWANLVDISVNSAVITLTFKHTQKDYQVAAGAPGSGTSTPASVQTAGGSQIPFGRFLVFDASDTPEGMALPSGADPADIRGVSVRSIGRFYNAGSPLASASDQIPPGNTFSAGYFGKIRMRNVGADAARGGSVFVVVNTAGGDELGQARGDDDAANSVELDSRAAYWAEAVPNGATGWVHLNL